MMDLALSLGLQPRLSGIEAVYQIKHNPKDSWRTQSLTHLGGEVLSMYILSKELIRPNKRRKSAKGL